MKHTMTAITMLMLSSLPCYASDIEDRLSEVERKLDLVTAPCGIWMQQHTAFLIARAATPADQRQKLIEVQAARKVACDKLK